METHERTPGRRIADYSAVSVYEYDDGTAELHFVRQDGSTKRVITELLSTVVQPKEEPFTLWELLIMAALEAAVRRNQTIRNVVW